MTIDTIPSRALIALLSLAPLSALAADAPGTPKPSTGAPGDKPGRGDPFGAQGEKAEEKPSSAEHAAERAKVVIDAIHVTGNGRTAEALILSHLLVKPGEDLDEEKVQLSRIRLLQLGPFSDVDAKIEPGSGEGHVTLNIKVTERNTLFLTDIIAGSTPFTHFYGGLGVADANFLGLGIGVSAVGLVGSNGRFGFRASAYDPDIRIQDVSVLAGAQYVVQNNRENACGDPSCLSEGLLLHYRREGGEVDAGIRSGAYERFLVSYRYEGITASLDPGASAQAMSLIHPGRSRLSALVAGFDRDARNETFLPTRGSRVQLQLTISSAVFGSSYEYSRYLVQVEQWLPQSGGRALRLDLVGGLVQGDAPFFDRFYAADWSYFSLGAASSRALEMNFSSDPRYDSVLVAAGAEYDFPLWTSHTFLRRGYLALGVRLVYSASRAGADRTPLSSFPVSGDVAIRADTPAGVFSASIGSLVDHFFKF